jgi:hypothetical protein
MFCMWPNIFLLMDLYLNKVKPCMKWLNKVGKNIGTFKIMLSVQNVYQIKDQMIKVY